MTGIFHSKKRFSFKRYACFLINISISSKPISTVYKKIILWVDPSQPSAEMTRGHLHRFAQLQQTEFKHTRRWNITVPHWKLFKLQFNIYCINMESQICHLSGGLAAKELKVLVKYWSNENGGRPFLFNKSSWVVNHCRGSVDSLHTSTCI